MTLAANIRARREELGLSREIVAARVRELGVSLSVGGLGDIERGATPQPHRLEALAKALGATVAKLAGEPAKARATTNTPPRRRSNQRS